ncbi:MAG TPA: M12 family metallo-peptidase [Steroidobacteraceae bacterium]|nr:M12 family metallo-peptidase [Steroidobacteraceae bacterium]
MKFGWARSKRSLVHTLLRVVACTATLAAANAHSAARINNAESVDLSVLTHAAHAGQQKLRSDHLAAQFDAFDRRFDLQLQVNSKWAPSQTPVSALALYRGTIVNAAGSWVRLGIAGEDVHGLIWDGRELFAIEPAAAVKSALIAPTSSSAHNVMFRIADTWLDPGSTSCEATDTLNDAVGKDGYASLVGELKSQAQTQRAPGATLKLDLAILSDSAFLARYAGKQEARDALLLRLNNIDGIYSSQLGIEIQAPTLLVDDASTDHLSSEADPSKLLAELANLRRSTPELRSRGLAHLFTGRDLQGTTVGIAYVDALCDQKYGVGLTQVGATGAWIDSLIAAHEIGHNFGAVHDGEAGKACASTPAGVYLMSPAVSGNEAFSQCSLDLIRPKIQSASCITALAPANITIPQDLGTSRHAADSPFDWQLAVTNSGGLAANGVHAAIALPAALTIEAASVADGTCTSGAGAIDCDLGSIAGGATRTITLSLQGAVGGSYSVAASASAQNDVSALDNSGSGSISISSTNDLSIAVTAPSSVNVRDAFTLSFDVVNSSARDAGSVVVIIPTDATVFAIGQLSVAGGQCQQSAGVVTCTIAHLAAGASATGKASLTANQAGTYALEANISGAYSDDQPGNDRAQAAVTVSASPTASVTNASTSTPKSKGGGGGSMSWLLLGLAAIRRARRYPN